MKYKCADHLVKVKSPSAYFHQTIKSPDNNVFQTVNYELYAFFEFAELTCFSCFAL